MSSIDEIKNKIDTLPFVQVSDDELNNLVSDIVNLLGLAGNGNAEIRSQFSIYASMLFDELITKINLSLYAQKALSIIGYPLADSVELIDCLGEAAIKDLLISSAKVLTGDNAEFNEEVLEIFSDCLGWSKKPNEINKELTAIAVYVSFTGALNKWLNSLH
ncbi:MAG: hypothetical protein ACP5I6_03570 [Caldisphaera sp.]|nr:MAG: hypothetical protein C0201_01360 [Caldisphaera sp.]